MFKKFIKGLMFGGGAAFLVLALIYAAPLLILFVFPERASNSDDIPVFSRSLYIDKTFQHLGIDEKIQQASAIALARYEDDGLGNREAIINEFIKIAPGTEMPLTIGEAFEMFNHARDVNTAAPEGIVLFFTDSPATLKEAASFSNGRIGAFNDISLDTLKEKCKKFPPFGEPIVPPVKKIKKKFHELTIEEQIKRADTIMLTRYEETSGGNTEAIIREFLKKDGIFPFPYHIGDIYPYAARLNDNEKDTEGYILLFIGSSMKIGYPYEKNGRLPFLANIPLDLFKEKCHEKETP